MNALYNIMVYMYIERLMDQLKMDMFLESDNGLFFVWKVGLAL